MYCLHFLTHSASISGASDSKESACSTGDPGLIPGLGRSHGEGNGYPLQHSCLENSMDGGAWQTIYSPWCCKKLSTAERPPLFFSHFSRIFPSFRFSTQVGSMCILYILFFLTEGSSSINFLARETKRLIQGF